MSEPRRVLYVLPNAKPGGAEQVTLTLIGAHDRSRWIPHAYFLSDGPLVEEARALGARCSVFEGDRPRLREPVSVAEAIRSISQVVRKQKIDLVHSVMAYGHLFGGPAALLARVPPVWFQHGPLGPIDWAAARVPARVLFVNSRYTLERQKRYRAWTKELKLVSTGVTIAQDLAAARAGAQLLRSRLGVGPEDVLFALFARMSPLKGQPLFLQAAAQLKGKVPGARFLIAGGAFLEDDVEYEREIHDLAENLGLSREVSFVGTLRDGSAPERTSALLAADVIVNASTVVESFGLTVAEAMMLGKPVIAPDQGGPAEIVTSGRDGLLFRFGDADDLLTRMRELALSEDLRKNLGEKARGTAEEKYTAQKFVSEIESEYDKVIRQHHGKSV